MMNEVIVLGNILTMDDVQVVEQVADWEDAIQLGVQPLIKHQCVDVAYVKAIVNNVKKHGSNYMLVPYVVLPHARPEQGVKKNGISILLTHKSYYVDEATLPIKLMIVLAPIDSKSHLCMLRYIANVLSDECRMKKIMESKTREEVVHQFTLENMKA